MDCSIGVVPAWGGYNGPYKEKARLDKNNNEREKERKAKHNRVAFEAAAGVGGTSSPYCLGQVLPTSWPRTFVPCLLFPSCFRQPLFPYDCCPPLPIPVGTSL